MKQHHFEVYVVTEGNALVPGVDLNSELSATWWDGQVYDDDSGMWGEWDDETSAAACEHLVRWLDFPMRVVRIYEQWTDGDGWDINIMSDIMSELIALGVVDPRSEIVDVNAIADGASPEPPPSASRTPHTSDRAQPWPPPAVR